MRYQIFSDATADLCPGMMAGLPPVEIIPMEVLMEGRSYTYGPRGDLSVAQFYAMQREGKFSSTSQINPLVYREAFERSLQEGRDVLYLCFSSGLSGTIESAEQCIRELSEEYPERKIVLVDTLCASAGEGLLVREAALRQAEGMALEELASWVLENRLRVCHWFTVDTFEHLRHGGRVSKAVAAIGTALKIKPLLHVDEAGSLKVVDKPRGRRRAIEAQIAHMKEGWRPEMGNLVLVGHGDCPVDAEMLREAAARAFPEAEIYIVPIGPIIGAHTGPDMLAVVYWGENR